MGGWVVYGVDVFGLRAVEARMGGGEVEGGGKEEVGGGDN